MSQSFSPPNIGYGGQVFATCWQSAAWLAGVLASGATPAAQVAQPALAFFQTCMNGADSVAAWQAAQALSLEQQNMALIQALPLSVDSTTLTFFNARVAAIAAAASGLAALPLSVSPFAASGLLAGGQPAIADPGYLTWCMSYAAETPPSGMFKGVEFVAEPSSLVPMATGMATAWMTVANAVAVLEGNALTTAYDAAARQYRVAATVASGLAAVSGAAGGFTQGIGTGNNIVRFNNPAIIALWNNAVAMPSLLLDAAALSSAPAWLANQQGAAIRFSLRAMALQAAILLLSLRAAASNGTAVASLRRNETLMDLAARAAGGFESWSAIAALNGIAPPWPGPTNQAVAAAGVPLLMPGGTSGAVVGTYAANVLGIDWDWGPINGAQPQWLGDIRTIVGYPNYARALGRRLQTPLGTLIYHRGYGSRIPGEVGAAAGADEAPKLAAFGNAAMLADPRTASTSNVAATLQPGFLASFSGVANPVGNNGTGGVNVNETINPLQ